MNSWEDLISEVIDVPVSRAEKCFNSEKQHGVLPFEVIGAHCWANATESRVCFSEISTQRKDQNLIEFPRVLDHSLH